MTKKKTKQQSTNLKKSKMDWKIVCAGLLCITALEICAISKGIDGVLLTTVIGIIALAIGVTIPNPLSK